MPRPTAILALILLAAAATSAQDPDISSAAFEREVRPLLVEWCVRCHNVMAPKGDLNLATFLFDAPGPENLGTLRKMRDLVHAGEMPPPSQKRPPPEMIARLVAFVDAALAAGVPAGALDPGHVTVRRLSRAEYANTVRDLLGLSFEATATFPADDLGYGFDNIGDSLTISPLLFEKYAGAAEVIAQAAILDEDPEHPDPRHAEAEFLESTLGKQSSRGDVQALYSNGEVLARVDLPRDGTYELRAAAFAEQAGPEIARLSFSADGRRLAAVEVPEDRTQPGVRTLRVSLTRGSHVIGFGFVNDYYQPQAEDRSQRDRNLYIDWVEVAGPVDRRDPPWSQQWIMAADPGQDPPAQRARPVVAALAGKAWRRPATPLEVKRLADLVAAEMQAGASFEGGLRLALEAVLVSPNFVFRLEPLRGDGQGIQDLDPWALATRLSYFIWSSMPDERLFALAADGSLSDPGVLRSEVDRMLADARSSALAGNFAAQWLELRNLRDAAPDVDRFPAFDEPLRRAMARESELFFEAILREKRPLRQLLDAEFTFLDQRLAEHYGIPGVSGSEWRRVALPDARRGGLVTQAGVQTVTSNPTRTSPVKRGKWILENILDAAPPPPPPGADSLDENAVSSAVTLREQMAAHRSEPVCAGCHTRMDALGLALENYDAIGGWRDRDAGGPIDSSGMLPDGRALSGPLDLKRVLAEGDAFTRCLAKKLFIYGVGRGTTETDELALDILVARLPADPTLHDVIAGIVFMDAFRRRGAP